MTNLFCAEQTQTEEKWILAAQKFDISQERAYPKNIEAMTSVIPKLILEQISLDTRRTMFRDELVLRKLDTLLTERLSLFLDLEKQTAARDSLVLNNYTMFEFQSALNEQEKKIAEIQKKIDKNLEEQKNTLHPEQAKRKVQKRLQKEFETHTDYVELYKNDPETLFEPNAESAEQGIDSRAFAKQIASEKISGLVSGSIVVYGNYVSVTTELYVFPGTKKIGSIVEVGLLSEIGQIAENIAFALIPKIANGIPVEIEFNFFPEEAIQNAELTIDSIVYTHIPEKIMVSSGVHSITVDAQGYERESFLYDFSGQKKFLVTVNFKEKSDGTVKLALKKFVPGSFFFGGKFIGESSRADFVDVPISVNGNTVFGYFEGTVRDKKNPSSEHIETMFMMIPGKLMYDGIELETNLRVYDVSKNIDKRRKMFYLSYSALVISLPFFFYTLGRYNTFVNGYNTGYGDVSYEEVNRYRTLSLIGMGITIACGVWTITELVLYLRAVDKTLPPKAKKITERTLRKMEMEREKAVLEEQRKLEEEQSALEEAAQENAASGEEE